MVLSDNEVSYLQTFIETVLVTIRNDDTGITDDLEDLALNAGGILGLSSEYMEGLE